MINVRNKGASGERELAAVLEGWALDAGVVVELTRNLEQSRNGGYDLVGIPTLAIEVKRVQSLAVDVWWRQAVRQAGPGQIPFLAYRQNKKPWAFRIRVVCCHTAPDGDVSYHVQDADLVLQEAKLWYQYHVYLNRVQLAAQAAQRPPSASKPPALPLPPKPCRRAVAP